MFAIKSTSFEYYPILSSDNTQIKTHVDKTLIFSSIHFLQRKDYQDMKSFNVAVKLIDIWSLFKCFSYKT